MKKYLVNLDEQIKVWVTYNYYVEAASPEEALEKAKKGECSTQNIDEIWWDGAEFIQHENANSETLLNEERIVEV